jgi:hypothetical protein
MLRPLYARIAAITLALAASPGPARSAPATAEFDAQPRVVAIGDVHGDLAHFTQVLRDAGLVDERLRWTGGRTHLVQLGDVPDRGPDTLEVIRLLQRLAKESRADGGAVHCLIGNHEAMNVYRDLRYVHPDEYAAFATPANRRRQAKGYADFVASIKAGTPEANWPVFDAAHRLAWMEKNLVGTAEHAAAWSPKGEIGRWVLDNPAVLRIGDTLFVHGGLGPGYETQSLGRINTAVRTALQRPEATQGTILRDENGPLWYRGLIQHPELKERPHLEKLLAQYKVKRIVVGHTPMPGVIMPRFGGRVIAADVGLNAGYSGGRACLVLEDGAAFALHHGTRLDIPTGGLVSVVTYLRKVSAIDPGSQPIGRLIRQFEARVESEAAEESVEAATP